MKLTRLVCFAVLASFPFHVATAGDPQGLPSHSPTTDGLRASEGLNLRTATGESRRHIRTPADGRSTVIDSAKLMRASARLRGFAPKTQSAGWQQQAYLKAMNAGANDLFGLSVAVSGDTLVIGALQESSSTTGVNSTPDDDAPGAGAAYVFVRDGTNWTQQAYLKASDTHEGDTFGVSVAISGDTVIIGATGESSIAYNAGAAYVFVRDGTNWTQQAYLKPSNPVGGACFGSSTAISGATAVVGAYLEHSSTTGVNSTPNTNALFAGAAYVFVRDGTNWTQQAYLKASNTGAGDQFGCAVAVSGDTVVVGARQESSSRTGVNSAPNESAPNAGAAYVFVRNGTSWDQQAYLKASNTRTDDFFGISVAVSSDTIVVGASDEDSSTTGINSIPNRAAASSGAAYVFVRNETSWAQQAYLKASNTGAYDYFGQSVAIVRNTIVVGAVGEDSSTTGVNSTPNEAATHSGAAYVFVRSGSTWTQQAYLKASNTGIQNDFGWAAVSGNTIVVGAVGEGAFGEGAAYVFTLPETSALPPVISSYSMIPGNETTPGAVALGVTGTTPNSMLRLEASSDLQSWTPLRTFQSDGQGNGASGDVSDSENVGLPARYYRVAAQ